MPILTIESTCDETAAAIIAEDGACPWGCSRNSGDTSRAIPRCCSRARCKSSCGADPSVIDTAIKRASIQPSDLDTIAVADRPGLAGSLLVGLVAAKTLAAAWNKPLVAINHLHAHLYACQLASDSPVYPCVGLVVSGGHTSLYYCRSPLDLDYLGGTIDDAAGEAFDKVAAMLQLDFPGDQPYPDWPPQVTDKPIRFRVL